MVESGLITDQEAIQIAKIACKGKVNVPPDAPIDVKLQGSKYTVIFKILWAKGVRGGDYHAKVVIDAKSKKVLEILSSD